MSMPSSLDSKILAITRNNLEAREFSELIASQGGRAIPLPTIEIVPKDPSAVDEFIDIVNKNKNEYCAFLSPQAVHVLFNHASRLYKTDELVSALNSRIVVAIGPKTKQRLVDRGIDVKMVPEKYSSLGLVELFSKMDNPDGKKILIPRSEASNEFVERSLTALKMVVNVFFLYTVRTSEITPVWKDFVLLFFEIAQKMQHNISSLLKNVKAVIAIGPMTNEELKKRAIHSFESSEHTIRGTVDLAKIILTK